MRNPDRPLTNRLILKLSSAFLLLIFTIGATYILTSIYFTNRYFEEVSQRLNSNLASHLIEEKFASESPFLEDGSVNKELFGDLMHDMMAVNRSIEVYLLNDEGGVLYSVVLDHSKSNLPVVSISTDPIKQYINEGGLGYVLGQDPRNPQQKKIFSAAEYNVDGHQGYVYIILSGQEISATREVLASSYFMRLGLGSLLLTMIFVTLMGVLSIWFLTKNLRSIIHAVKRFREGDRSVRIADAERSDVAVLATNFNEMADTIEQNIADITQVDRLRRELIANVSHDLRTPLAILKGYIETLQIKQQTLTGEEKGRYLKIIEESSEKLSELISQLFEYSKLEAKQVKLEKEAFSIVDLVGDLALNYKLLAEEKNIAIEVVTEKKIPLVFADIKLVERALQNLLDNAIKFTPENGEIIMSLDADAQDVKFKIKDSGPGISTQDQSYIFERYKQTTTDHKRLGVGLGLAIVKKIMELHDTQIVLKSQEEKGSVFEFELPVAV